MDIYLLGKIIFIPQTDISVLKIPVSELDFFQTWGFHKMIKKLWYII